MYVPKPRFPPGADGCRAGRAGHRNEGIWVPWAQTDHLPGADPKFCPRALAKGPHSLPVVCGSQQSLP